MTGPEPSSAPPGGPQFSLAWILGAFGLAVAVVAVIAAIIVGAARLTAASRAPVLTATATPLALSTHVVFIPTTTPLPPATDTPAASPTPSSVPESQASATPAAGTEAAATATIPASGLVRATTGANVRNGPGLNYAVIAGMNEGDTAPALGRDSSGTWFAIALRGAGGCCGWIAAQVSSYDGDTNSLEVIAAPAAPAATSAAAAPTSPPATSAGPAPGQIVNARGLSARLTLCSNRTTYAVNERVCFIEWIKNNTDQPIRYGILGVQADNLAGGGQFQTSWSGIGPLAEGGQQRVDPGCEGPTDRCGGQWEDGIRIATPGTYRLTMRICFSPLEQCQGAGGDWAVMSAPITITVQ
jgi:hypothetical protein